MESDNYLSTLLRSEFACEGLCTKKRVSYELVHPFFRPHDPTRRVPWNSGGIWVRFLLAQASPSFHQVPVEDPRYFAGLGCVLLGAGGAFVCDGMLPQSTLAPLTCQIIVYKVALGRLVLGERVPKRTWLAVAVMGAGMVVSLCGANLVDGSYRLEGIRNNWAMPSKQPS